MEYPSPGIDKIRLGGYRNSYYGSGHIGANYDLVEIGGENNVYQGIFFDCHNIISTSFSNGQPFFLSECHMGYFEQGGGAMANLTNCFIDTLKINGNSVSVNQSNIGVLDAFYTAAASPNNYLTASVIDKILTKNGSTRKLVLHSCIINNTDNIDITGDSIILNNCSFKGMVNLNFPTRMIVSNCLFKKANFSGYAVTPFYNTSFDSLILGVNAQPVFTFCRTGYISASGRTAKFYLSKFGSVPGRGIITKDSLYTLTLDSIGVGRDPVYKLDAKGISRLDTIKLSANTWTSGRVLPLVRTSGDSAVRTMSWSQFKDSLGIITTNAISAESFKILDNPFTTSFSNAYMTTYKIDAANEDRSVTLNTNQLPVGYIVNIKKTDGSLHTVTLKTNKGSIDDADKLILSGKNTNVQLQWDGSGFIVLHNNSPVQASPCY
jgi:hypothetical protein